MRQHSNEVLAHCRTIKVLCEVICNLFQHSHLLFIFYLKSDNMKKTKVVLAVKSHFKYEKYLLRVCSKKN